MSALCVEHRRGSECRRLVEARNLLTIGHRNAGDRASRCRLALSHLLLAGGQHSEKAMVAKAGTRRQDRAVAHKALAANPIGTKLKAPAVATAAPESSHPQRSWRRLLQADRA
jgi:hypothetical protein